MKRLPRTDRLSLVVLFLYDILFFVVAVAFFHGILHDLISQKGLPEELIRWYSMLTILVHAGYKIRLTPQKNRKALLPVDHRTQLIRHYVQWILVVLIVHRGLNTSWESMAFFAITDAVCDIAMIVLGIRNLEQAAE